MDREELRKNKERVLELVRSLNVKEFTEEDKELFISDLERMGFFTAPASINGHQCYEGGLMCHSLNVYEAAMMLKQTFMAERPDIFEKISDDSIIIASLFHDMCKVDLYFRKVSTQVSAPNFGRAVSRLPIGHGEKSVVMLLQMGVPLSDEEICAIRWHMGAWGVNRNDSDELANYREADKHYPLVSLIHLADTIATKFTERPPATINRW